MKNWQVLSSYLLLGLGLPGLILITVFAGLIYGLIFIVVLMLFWLVLVMGDQTGSMNRIVGNVFLITGVVVSLLVFIFLGLQPNLFGGTELNFNGLIAALLVLFLSILLGLIFFRLVAIEERLELLRKEFKEHLEHEHWYSE